MALRTGPNFQGRCEEVRDTVKSHLILFKTWNEQYQTVCLLIFSGFSVKYCAWRWFKYRVTNLNIAIFSTIIRPLSILPSLTPPQAFIGLRAPYTFCVKRDGPPILFAWSLMGPLYFLREAWWAPYTFCVKRDGLPILFAWSAMGPLYFLRYKAWWAPYTFCVIKRMGSLYFLREGLPILFAL
jgi:hypothetical protein